MDLSTIIHLVAVAALAAVVLLLVPARVASQVRAALLERLDTLDRNAEKTERGLREELGRGRGEAAVEAQRQREATAADAQRQRDEVRAQLVEMARLLESEGVARVSDLVGTIHDGREVRTSASENARTR